MSLSEKSFSVCGGFLVSVVGFQNAFAQQAAQVPAASPPPPAADPLQVPGAAAAAQSGMPGWINFVLIGGIIIFMWLFVFRPQSKRAKEQREFLSSLQPGAEVITSGGIIGLVVEVKENIVSLNVGNATVRVLKSSISGKLDTNAPSVSSK